MSDDVLSVIPDDPCWQPDRATGERAARLAEALCPGLPGGTDVEVDVAWHDAITVVDSGENLAKIGCPLCGAAIDVEWWAGLLEEGEGTVEGLAVDVPCCGGATSLDALEFDWPCGFARFEIAVWNPERAWFGEAEMAALANALGHPVRQIRAHI